MTEYIELGGQKRPFRMSYRAIKKVKKAVAAEHDELDQLEITLLAGFEAGAKAEKVTFKGDQEAIADWLDDEPEKMPEIMKVVERASKEFSDLFEGKVGNGKKPQKPKK